MSTVPHRNAGFTLIEVMVAVTILAVGIGGAMSAVALSFRASSDSQRLEEAWSLAERTLHEAVTTPIDRLAPRTGSEGPRSWSLTLEDMPHHLMSATVTVEWLRRGRTEVFQLSEVFAPVPSFDR